MSGRHSAEDVLWSFNEAERRHAPRDLFLAGDRDLLRSGPTTSIIGSRKASPCGVARAQKLARMLVERGVIVVSGLSEGIDTAAHRAAIDAGGRTIAVLGTPLDQCFPAKNRTLQQEIACDHLAVSQLPSGTKVGRHTFPIRNKTMALISDATVIIEAADRGGTLHPPRPRLREARGREPRPIAAVASIALTAAVTVPPDLPHPPDWTGGLMVALNIGHGTRPLPVPSQGGKGRELLQSGPPPTGAQSRERGQRAGLPRRTRPTSGANGLRPRSTQSR